MGTPAAQRIGIGRLGICFSGRFRKDLPEAFAAFAGRAPCVSRWQVLDEPASPQGSSRLLCDGETWALFAREGGLRYEGYAPPLWGREPVLQADASSDWSSGVVRVVPERCPPATRLAPVASPFGELLLTSLLNLHGGLYVHAASVLRQREALLFLGRSGAGKTTLSRLATAAGAQVLSDDRTALRLSTGNPRGRLVAHGTPFHGTGRFWAARHARVAGLFFLEHGRSTELRRLSLGDAVTRLAALSFGPFWNKESLDAMLRACEAAARAAPAYELRFVPDHSALEALDAIVPSVRFADRRS